jgi:hypothetical protein
MVTHDPIAAAYADAVVFLSDGRIVDSLYREGAPLGVRPSGRWATTVGSGDAADRAGTVVVSESGEPLPDAAVSPPGVLLCQADEQSAELIVDGRASRRVG